jgi:hypothetical protein
MAKRKYLNEIRVYPELKKVTAIYHTDYTDGRGKNKRVVGTERDIKQYDEESAKTCKDETVKKAIALVID